MSYSKRARLGLAWGMAIVAWCLATEGHAQQPTTAKQYLIRCKLTENGPDGKPKILAAPALITTVGRAAEVAIGETVVPTIGEGKAAQAFNGMKLTTTLLRVKDGQLLLDATLTVSSTIESSDKRLRVMDQAIRTVEPLTLKQAIIVPAGETDDQRLEITVEEAEPAVASKPVQPPTTESKPAEPSKTEPAALEPTPASVAQPSPRPTPNGGGGSNPLRGPLGGIRARLRGR